MQGWLSSLSLCSGQKEGRQRVRASQEQRKGLFLCSESAFISHACMSSMNAAIAAVALLESKLSSYIFS